VNVIFHGIDQVRVAAKVFEHRCHVSMERITYSFVDDGSAVFGAENEMQINFREGLGHALINRSPLQGLRLFFSRNPGRCPGLTLSAPLALQKNCWAKSDNVFVAGQRPNYASQGNALGRGSKDTIALKGRFNRLNFRSGSPARSA
jgi:hypothetical protein